MKIVIVSPQWTQEPLFDLGFHEVFHDGLGRDVFAHVTALGNVTQSLETVRSHLPRTPQSVQEILTLANQTVRTAQVLLGQFLTPGSCPGCKWLHWPGLTFRSINDKHFAAWLRHAAIDVVVLVGTKERPKVNLLTSAPHAVDITIERMPLNTARGVAAESGDLVIRTLIESRKSCAESVRMELGDLAPFDSHMIGDFAVSYFAGYLARLRQLVLEPKSGRLTLEKDLSETDDAFAHRDNG